MKETSSFVSYPDQKWLSNLSLLALVLIWGVSYFVILPISLNLALMTSFIIYLGCHRSLRLLDHEAIPLEEKETISEGDAYKVPIIASVSLGLFYVAFKFLDKDTVNLVLSLYFCLVGILSLTITFSPLFSFIIKSSHRYELKFGITFSVPELIAFILSTLVTILYFQTKHYMLNNLLGISFCIQALERVSIGSYKIGCIILVGLFFYDIFWVFGTEVMVTVAKSFDAPIKLLFPQVFPSVDLPQGKFNLLGLGDIVVPGIFISLLLRYDAHRALVNPVSAETKAFPKPYFHFTLFAYLLGIVLTVFVMYFFNSAQVSQLSSPHSAPHSLTQPALLYLVPACLLSTLLVGLWRQDMTHLWEYDEAKIYEEARAKLTEQEEREERDRNQEGQSTGSSLLNESLSNSEASQRRLSLEVEDKKER